jgi:hypothetical protein
MSDMGAFATAQDRAECPPLAPPPGVPKLRTPFQASGIAARVRAQSHFCRAMRKHPWRRTGARRIIHHSEGSVIGNSSDCKEHLPNLLLAFRDLHFDGDQPVAVTGESVRERVSRRLAAKLGSPILGNQGFK